MSLDSYMAESLPFKLEQLRERLLESHETDNYERFLSQVKKLYPNIDSIKSSNMLIRI
jgi:hypothetical protein